MSDDDPFAPLPEADAYRVWLFMSDDPYERDVRTILRRDFDASVSFARWWIHEAQPQPQIPSRLFDAWEIERMVAPFRWERVANGRAEGQCKWSKRRFGPFTSSDEVDAWNTAGGPNLRPDNGESVKRIAARKRRVATPKGAVRQKRPKRQGTAALKWAALNSQIREQRQNGETIGLDEWRKRWAT